MGHSSSGGDGDQLWVAVLLSPVGDRLGCGRWPQDSAPIAGGIDRWNFGERAAPPPLQSWCGKQPLEPASVALAPTSSRGRLISLSCHLENAATGASVTDMGNHQGSSTNSFCFFAEISAVGGIDCAAAAGEVWRGGSRCPTSRCSGRRPSALGRCSSSRGRAALQMVQRTPRGPVSATIDHHLRPSPLIGRSLDGLGTWGGVRKLKGGNCLVKANLPGRILV